MIVDARGLSCPTPLIMALQALKKENHFDIIVDNEVAFENITRTLKEKFSIIPDVERKGEEITIRVRK